MKTYRMTEEDINNWYKDEFLIPTTLGMLTQNEAVLMLIEDGREIGIFKDGYITRCAHPEAFGVRAKNKEQQAAMINLLDDDIKLKIITGREGTGKNYITAACLLEKLLNGNKYDKLILTRTTDEVGKSLGLMPGTVDEKFGVHVNSFIYTMAAVMGGNDTYLKALMDKGNIKYMPIQFMRGVSFPKGTIIWADEIAGLSPFELRMLCTRLGEDCLLVLTGSLEQIDRKLAPENTGLYRLIHSGRIQSSELVSHVELIENERSAISTLISEVL